MAAMLDSIEQPTMTTRDILPDCELAVRLSCGSSYARPTAGPHVHQVRSSVLGPTFLYRLHGSTSFLTAIEGDLQRFEPTP
jgi:hypothetical protein